MARPGRPTRPRHCPPKKRDGVGDSRQRGLPDARRWREKRLWVLKVCRECLLTPGPAVSRGRRRGRLGLGTQDGTHLADARLEALVSVGTPTSMVVAKTFDVGFLPGLRSRNRRHGSRKYCLGRGRGRRGLSRTAEGIELVADGDLVDGGRHGSIKVRGSPGLQNDGVSGASHGEDVGVLEGRHPSVGREGVQDDDLEEDFDIRKEPQAMVEELRRKLVVEGLDLEQLTCQLSRSFPKVTEEDLASFGVWRRTGGPDERVDGGTSCRSEKREKGVEAF